MSSCEMVVILSRLQNANTYGYIFAARTALHNLADEISQNHR